MGLKYADVIVDLQAGDTGKGKVAHHLLSHNQYDLVLRYNGGANAGHTIYHNGKKIVTHQVPMGVIHGIPSVIGLGCVVDIPALIKEIDELNDLGIATEGLILIDKRAHLVTQDHLNEDSQEGKLGTTRRGIGPAYRNKYGRTGIRMGGINTNIYRQFRIIDIYDVLFVNRHEKRILCEGAQGWQIDIDWGDYPYVTSSHCTVGSAILNGIPPKKLRKIVGTMKAYETYSGFKTHFMDESDVDLKRLQEVGNEFGATTGRARKTRWLNLDEVVRATNVNGVTEIVINKIDVIEEVGVFKLFHNNNIKQFPTAAEFVAYVTEILYDKTDIDSITWSRSPNEI
jgi:adenylosuccinate synthase